MKYNLWFLSPVALNANELLPSQHPDFAEAFRRIEKHDSSCDITKGEL